jgi:hypothetical protein
MSLNIESRLNDLQWNDLKRIAKENGIKVSGTREVLTNEILNILQDEPAAALSDINTNKAGFESPKLTAPKRGKSTLKKSTKKRTPAKGEEIVIVLPTEEEAPVEEFENNCENVPPISLFPSPQIHHRQSRKPMIRSPEPEEKISKPRTPAKSNTPKKTVASVKRSTRKAKVVEEAVEAAPVMEPMSEPVKVQESEPVTAPRQASSSIHDMESESPVNSKNAIRVVIAAGIIALASSMFPSSAVASTPSIFIDSISLKGPNPMYLTQGDVYHEPGVSFAPDLAKTMVAEGRATPTVGFEYSEAGIAFSDYMADVGSFEVEYTVAAPWLGEIKMTREVIINDVNECEYNGAISAFKHTCSASETCTNTVGSFACE